MYTSELAVGAGIGLRQLDRLLPELKKDGLVVWEEEGNRVYYQLTDRGRAVVKGIRDPDWLAALFKPEETAKPTLLVPTSKAREETSRSIPYEHSLIKGRESVKNHCLNMINGASGSIAIATTRRSGLGLVYDYYSVDLERVSKRGVKVRIIAPIGDWNVKIAMELEGSFEVRNSSLPTMRFVIVDSKGILFNDVPDFGSYTNDPLIVKGHEEYFDQLWSMKHRKPKPDSGATRLKILRREVVKSMEKLEAEEVRKQKALISRQSR